MAGGLAARPGIRQVPPPTPSWRPFCNRQAAHIGHGWMAASVEFQPTDHGQGAIPWTRTVPNRNVWSS